MKYLRDEAIRYMGAKRGDHDAEVLVDLAYLKLRNEVRAKSCWQFFDCSVGDSGVKILNADIFFVSEKLAQHLSGCTKIAVLAATLGRNADITLRRLSLTNVAQAAAAQAVCAALIEAYCDEVQEDIAGAAEGMHLKPRFSPGYGDWQLQEQRKLLLLLNCEKKIGLTLTDGYMLSPVKSVTAVIGLTADAVSYKSKCRTCMNIDCEFRRG